MAPGLEPAPVEMDALGGAALAFVRDFIAARAGAPASDPDVSATLLARLQAPPPEDGRPLDGVLSLLGEAAGKGFDTAGPGYLAFIPGGGLFTAAIADLLADGVNRFVNVAAAAPALVQLEVAVGRWLCDLFALPPSAMGLLTTGGSMSILSAIVAAREDRLGAHDRGHATLYVSEQAHHAVAKSASIVGFRPEQVRTVACDRELRLDVDALARAVAADERPFLVVASAGTTNTGAVDEIAAIADVAAERGLWLHVDAAYGGFFQLTARGRAAFAGIERADSITLDPHKGMFLPYGTGALLIRDRETLRRAHHLGATYLQDLATGNDLPDLADYSPELSRDFRGLRVWLPLHLHGVGAFRDALDEKLDLARLAYDTLAADPHFEVPWEPALSVVAFRLREGDDAANRALLSRINASRRVFLSSTIVDGRFTLRLCVLSVRTHRDRVEEALAIIRSAGREIRG